MSPTGQLRPNSRKDQLASVYLVADIEEVSPPGFLWAISRNPAYFVQYQLKSAALLKIKNKVLIVWRPKYIEYPSYVKFPELR
jgi:hypothetical protein